MEIALILISVCLLVVLAGAIIKLAHIKSELKRFSEEVRKLKNIDYEQPVKLTCFDKDVVDLAIAINEHVDIQRALALEYDQANKRLNNVISGISHDFRTPLTASLGYLQMVQKNGSISGKDKEYLDIAIKKNEYLKELSDEFFELTKLENSQDEITTEKVNLSNLLSECLLSQYTWLEKRNITPELAISDGVIITSNAHIVSRILENLFSNAEKYASKRIGVTLSDADGTVVLKVFNDIDDESAIDIKRIFEPFYRASSRSKEGSGLGLYVVKTLCDKFGYQLEAQINEDKTFSIEIKFK